MGSSEAAFHGVLQGRRDDACRWARPRRLSTGFCRAAEAMLADGLVQGGFLRDFAGSPRRCSPKGSSEAAFHGLLQGRRGDACRWARPRRLSTGFSNGGAARSAAVPFCPSFPRRLAVLLSLPSARTTMPHEHIPVHANRRAVPTLFHIFPARPSRVSSFTLPPGQRYRARSPRRCSPMGSSEAGFHGLLQGRRGDASRWARLRRLSAGFCRVAEAMLPDGLVRGGFPRGFATAALRAAPPFPFVLLSPATWPYFFLYHPPGQRCRAPLFLHPFVPLGGRDSAAFFAACTGGGVVRSLFALSAARPALHLFFYTPPPGERMPRARSRPCEPAGSPFPFPHFPTARPYFFLYHPPGQRCRTSTFPFTQTGGQSLPFSTFSRAPESCFFLYPAARPTIPRATFPSSICPAGRQGQRRFLCRLPGRRSSALPFRPIGGAPGTAPLFLHPAARGTDAARPFPPMRTGGQSLPFSTFSRAPESCFFLYPAARPTIPRTVAEAMLAKGLVRGGFLRGFAGPPRRCFPLGSSEAASHGVFQRRHCAQRRRSLLSFSPPPPGERMPRARSRPCEPAGSPFPFPHFPTARSYFFLYPAVLPAIPRTVAAAMLPDGLVRGGFLRAFAGPPRRCFPLGSSEAAFCGVLKRRRCAQCRRTLLPFFPPPPGERMPRARSRPCEPAGSPFPFPHFPTARPYFFLYPAVLPTMPRATFPASICPAGRQGQRRFLCRLPGRRSSALPFRPIGGAPGAASLSSIPSRPDSGCRARSPPSPKPASEPFPFPILSDNARAHSRSREPAGCPFPFPLFPDSRHVLPGGGHARLIPPAPARGCSRRISPSISAPLCLPRSPLLCARPFRAGFFGSALPCSPPPRAVSGPVPARADASRRSFAFPHARPACAPAAHALCARPVRIASRRGKL